MRRKGIPKKRIGPEPGSRERSIRERRIKVTGYTLNAAQKSAYGIMSTSLCGKCPVMMESFYGEKDKKREIKIEKEVMKERELLNVLLGGRSRKSARYELRKSWGLTFRN